MIKTYKIFGITILEVETSVERPQGLVDKFKKPQGELLSYSPKERAKLERQKLEEQL